MTNPHPYAPSFSFTGYQATNPTKPLPGPRIDTEFENIGLSITETETALADIRRSDGALQNGIVTVESLDPGMALGILPPTIWATATEYKPPQSVWNGNKLYQCLVNHISGSFDEDFDAGYWNLVVDFDPPIEEAEAAAAAAQASATAAQGSATSAQNSATSANGSAVAAGGFANQALAARDAAQGFRDEAYGYANSASNFANQAAASAATATTEANRAKTEADRAVAATDSKYDKTGGAITGAVTVVTPAGVNATLGLNKPASGLVSQLYGATAGLNRWTMNLGDSTGETGANAGSDFGVRRFNDAGAVIDTALSINRATGIVGMPLGATTATPAPGDNDTSVATTAFVTAAITAAGAAPVGSIAYVPSANAPTNYLKANGALVSRTTYAALWAYAQTAAITASDAAWTGDALQQAKFSPGDGATTFRLPDIRGDFVRGVDDGRGIDTGRVSGTRQSAAFASHTHTADAMGTHYHQASVSTPVYSSGIASLHSGQLVNGTRGQMTGTSYTYTDGVSAGTPSINAAGGTETRPINAALLACIRYQ